MTRINTNVSSLIGRNNLANANADLSQSLQRLSTGLRINTGRDDPAGLIASENLRSDITAIRRAISNTDRANQVIATADSALGQVSSLLNDIRGLVTESANAGALSDEQIAANQLQVDSSLEALNRIAQTTTFQGRRLLDGSLDFTTNAGAEFTRLSDLQIDQANLGASGSVSLDVNVTAAATQASLDVSGIVAGVAAQTAAGSLTFTSGAPATGDVEFNLAGTAAQAGTGSGDFTIETAASTQASGTARIETQVTGTLTIETEANADFTFNSQAAGTLTIGGSSLALVAETGGNADGADGNDVTELQVNYNQGADTSTFDSASGVLTVNIQATASGATIADINTAINAGTDFASTTTDGANAFTAAQADAATFAVDGGAQELTLQAVNDGDSGTGEGNPAISAIEIQSNTANGTTFNTGTGVLTVDVNVDLTGATITVADVATAINAGSDFTVDVSGLSAEALTAEFDLGAVNGTFTGATVAGAPTVTGINESIDLTAVVDGTDASAIDTLEIQFGGPVGTTISGGNTLQVNVGGVDRNVTLQDLVDAINAGTDFTADLGGADGTATFDPAGTTPDDDANANFDLALAPASTINLTAEAGGDADGIAGNTAATIAVQFGQTAAGTSFNTGTNVLTVNLTQADGVATVADLIAAVNAGTDFNATAGASDTAALLQAADDTAAGAITIDTNGADATTTTESFDFNTVAGADNDFDIAFTTAASGDITDFSGADTTLFGLSGNASTGYVVTLANDATTNLANLANDLASAITELDSVGYTGGAGVVYDPSRNADQVVDGGATVSVTGSAAATTSPQTISLSAQGQESVAVTFQYGTVLGAAITDIQGDVETGLTVTIDDSAPVLLSAITTDLDAVDGLSATFTGSGSISAASELTTTNLTLNGGQAEGDDVITITADATGAESNRTITFATDNALADGAVTVTDDGTTITVTADGNSVVNLSDIVNTLNSELDGFTATLSANAGTGTFENGVISNPTVDQPDEGQTASGGIAADAVIELSGTLGAEVFNLQQGTTLTDLVNQIQLVSDATGVTAQAGVDGTTLELRSTTFGSDSLVDLRVIEEDSSGTFTTEVGSGSRVTGTDIQATVNGVEASGDGNRFSINTATLDLAASVEAGFTGTVEFDVTGGGALFQLGPDVVSNQQARLGIGSVNTAALGGVNGALYQLASGGTADLATDATTAARIVEEAIDQVTSLRGRLGAFQRTTLETNKNALNNTLSNLTDAESSIRDADFAEETANLTRSQILVQSGTRVLAIANQNPQNVLALLG